MKEAEHEYYILIKGLDKFADLKSRKAFIKRKTFKLMINLTESPGHYLHLTVDTRLIISGGPNCVITFVLCSARRGRCARRYRYIAFDICFMWASPVNDSPV